MRYKLCTNPSNYDGGAYCGKDVDDIKEMEDCDSSTPVCYHGECGCSKDKSSNAKGDGTTQGTCSSKKICHYDGMCRAEGNYLSNIFNI